MAKHNEIGKLGEDIATMFLKKHGFTGFTRNFREKYGEIDIISEKDGKTHFIEVKTVSRENLDGIEKENIAEENVTREKLSKLSRVISTYVEKERVLDWQFDVIAVYLNTNIKTAKVRFIENQILPE